MSVPQPSSYRCLLLNSKPLLTLEYEAAASHGTGLLCLQDPKVQDKPEQVMAAICSPGQRLGAALQRPDVIARATAWEPCAVPVLCILALASSGLAEQPRMRLQLQPAHAECTRYTQAAARSFPDCRMFV
jgi:hypothetical protein